MTSLQPCASQAGVKGMRAGEYRAAVTAFTQAIATYPGGMTTRKGGEYAVWLAQALHARGQTGEAKKLLKSIEKHPDGDVRSVADSVLYIYQAPTHACITRILCGVDSHHQVQPNVHSMLPMHVHVHVHVPVHVCMCMCMCACACACACAGPRAEARRGELHAHRHGPGHQ